MTSVLATSVVKFQESVSGVTNFGVSTIHGGSMTSEMKAWRSSGFWFLVSLMVLSLLLSCSDSTGPELKRVPSEAEFSANLKANGINYGSRGVCDPGPGGTVAQVNVCFSDLMRALAVGGAAARTCGLAIGASATVVGAIGAGSICLLGVYSTGDAIANWYSRTEVGLWANQSAEEISNRMKQAIYERMVKRGLWGENAGCC